MKIIHNQKKCIGCGGCVVACPDFFEMGEEGKAVLKGGKLNQKTKNFELEIKDKKCIQEAIDVCPVQSIKLSK
ncbi:MAG: ferredoxin [Minisyncoccia bacterium]